MWPVRTVVYVNPWSALRGPEPSEQQRKEQEQTFLDLFQLAVETEDPREERWAYEKLRELYWDAIASRGDDRVPSFLDAMRWAAQAIDEPA